MVITWGKLAIAIVTFLVPAILAIWNFAGDSRASEVSRKSEVDSLKAAATDWKETMKEANEAFKNLTITVVRLDERLKASADVEVNHEQRIQKLEDGNNGRNP
jgi:hypothetical protein